MMIFRLSCAGEGSGAPGSNYAQKNKNGQLISITEKKNSRITDPDIVGWRSSIEITARSSSRSGSSFVIREVIQTGRIFGRHVPHRSEPPIEDITRSCEHTKFLLAIVWPGEGVGFFLLSHPPPTLRAPIGNTTSASCLSQNEQDEDEQSGGSMEWILGDSINTC